MKADLALASVFAGLVDRQDVWKRALEGFNVRESTVVNEWKAEERAAAVQDVLETRFGPLPAELTAKVTEARNADVLKQWTVLAARADTLEQFRQQAGI